MSRVQERAHQRLAQETRGAGDDNFHGSPPDRAASIVAGQHASF
jgi:hypothetical protein